MPPQRHALSLSECAFATLLAAVFFALRWPLLFGPGRLLGWNSDAALYGLMAEHMVRTGRPIFLFWGGDYQGTLTSMWAVASSLITAGVNPLALRVGSALQIIAAILLFRDALRREYGPLAASVAALWLAAGPFFLFKLSYAPVSAEQMLFIGASIFWYGTRAPFERTRQWIVLGVLGGVAYWAHRGALFALLPVASIAFWLDGWWRSPRRVLAASTFFSAGVGVGVLPLVIGRLSLDQRLYIPVVPGWSLRHVKEQVTATWQRDLWAFLGIDVPGAPAAGLLLLGFAAYAVARYGGRTHLMAIGLVVTNAGFWLLSPQAYPGALRYLILSLPIVYTWFAAGVLGVAERGRPQRLFAAAVVVAFFLLLHGGRFADARAVARGEREQHEHWPGGFDPRPVLTILERERYSACYADFWLAYKLEWLSATDVQFIPHRGVNSTQSRSLRLAAAEGRKCFIGLDGSVKTLNREEEEWFRADTIRLVRGNVLRPASSTGAATTTRSARSIRSHGANGVNTPGSTVPALRTQ